MVQTVQQHVSYSRMNFIWIRRIYDYRVAQKNKPVPNYQQIVLNRIKVCQWD